MAVVKCCLFHSDFEWFATSILTYYLLCSKTNSLLLSAVKWQLDCLIRLRHGFYSKPRLFGMRDDGEGYFHTNPFPSGPKSFVENPDTKAFKRLSNGIHTSTVCSALKTNEQAFLAVTQTPIQTHTHIRSSSPLCLPLMNSWASQLFAPVCFRLGLAWSAPYLPLLHPSIPLPSSLFPKALFFF